MFLSICPAWEGKKTYKFVRGSLSRTDVCCCGKDPKLSSALFIYSLAPSQQPIHLTIAVGEPEL